MKVTLEERNAYLPGELLKMFVEVKNFTSYNIERLDVTLTRVSKVFFTSLNTRCLSVHLLQTFYSKPIK